MMRRIVILATCLHAAVACSVVAQDLASLPFRVSYVSSEAVYVNAGKLSGLAAGDTLSVTRSGRAVASVVIVSVASHSAACRVLETGRIAQVDDQVQLRAKAIDVSGRPPTGGERGRVQRGYDHVSGYLSFQNHWQRDLTDSDLSWLQPSLNARLMVDRIGGRPISFRLRYRSLGNFRSGTVSDRVGEDEWIHRLTEAALIFGDDEGHYRVGVGRVLVQEMGGIGYTDGVYTSVRVGDRYRVGGVAGTMPDLSNGGFRQDHQRAGLFVSRAAGAMARSHLATTLALSSSRVGPTANRDFVYLQNRYSYGANLSLYQSVEIDFNRQWRQDVAHERFSFSNLYLTGHANVGKWAMLDASFDAVKAIWTYEMINMSDSLFDDALSRGFDGALTLDLPLKIRLRTSMGRRFGQGGLPDIDFFSVYASSRNLIRRGDFLMLRHSRSETATTLGQQPAASYQFPVGTIRVSIGAGGYLYEAPGLESKSIYYELGAQAGLRRYFFSGDVRHYVTGTLESIQIIAQAGLDF